MSRHNTIVTSFIWLCICKPRLALRFGHVAIWSDRVQHTKDSYLASRDLAEERLAEVIRQIPDGVLDTPTYRFEWVQPISLVWDYYGMFASLKVSKLALHKARRVVSLYIPLCYAAPNYDCGSKQRLGSIHDGGKWVCEIETSLQQSGCVVYSLGSHMQVDFEEDVLRKTRCEVFTFDYALSEENGQVLRNISPRMHFHSYKVGMGQSHSTQYVERSVDAIMQEFGHKELAILKMDIEEGEWEVLEGLIAGGQFYFNQLQVEFHVTTVSLRRVLNVFSGLTKAGYRVFSVEPNLYCCSGSLVEYSFIKTRQ